MKFKLAFVDLLRMGAGAAVMLVMVLMDFHNQRERSPAQQIELKARKADMVGRMRFSMAAASEAEETFRAPVFFRVFFARSDHS